MPGTSTVPGGGDESPAVALPGALACASGAHSDEKLPSGEAVAFAIAVKKDASASGGAVPFAGASRMAAMPRASTEKVSTVSAPAPVTFSAPSAPPPVPVPLPAATPR